MSTLLKDYPVIVEFPVAWGEMDAMNHVNNIVYFRYFESARIAYFEKIDVISYMTETGIGPILATTSCKFKIPLSYPDTVLIGAKVINIEEDRFVMHYLVVSHKHQKVAAEGDGVIVTFNYREGKKVKVPEVIKQRILDIEKSALGKIPTSSDKPMAIMTESDALNIFNKYIQNKPDIEVFKITDSLPDNCSPYGAPREGCWYVLCSSHPGQSYIICSSRLIAISKESGEVIYDGSANDEG
jgi:acyl-CoA thioester hydrolase